MAVGNSNGTVARVGCACGGGTYRVGTGMVGIGLGIVVGVRDGMVVGGTMVGSEVGAGVGSSHRGRMVSLLGPIMHP